MAAKHKMNDKEIEKVIANAKSSLAIEGMIVTDKETEVIRKYIKGDITEKEVLKIIKRCSNDLREFQE